VAAGEARAARKLRVPSTPKAPERAGFSSWSVLQNMFRLPRLGARGS
jgi:hypothetical protein